MIKSYFSLLLIHNKTAYNTNVYPKMIFQKDKRNDAQVKLKGAKNNKPYSVMSVGFSKPPHLNKENRLR